MEAKIVDLLSEFAPNEISVDERVPLWNLRLNRLKTGFQPLVSSRESIAILMFGLPGTGKSDFARSLGRSIWKQNKDDIGLRIDCRKAQDISNGSSAHAFREIETLFDSAPSNPKDGWVVVVEGMELLFQDEMADILTPLGDRIFAIINQQANPALVIGATKDPGALDYAALSRFSKVLYFGPVAVTEMPQWLAMEGVSDDAAKLISERLLEKSNHSEKDFLAPRRLLGALRSLSNNNQNLKNLDPDEIADLLSPASERLFIEAQIAEEYQDKHRVFVEQSNILEEMFGARDADRRRAD